MVTLSDRSDEVCKRIIATEFHADVLDYLNSMDKLPDDRDDKWTVYCQLLVLCNVVSRTSPHDDFSQRHAVDIARKFPTLTDDKVIFPTYYSAVASTCVCLPSALSTPASCQ